ncbi:hypothetical protein BRYFOR_05664 [Marvinbryantia formatexigens DSM 14469]|uniref:Uncharacterized protein n=1 Tax=Marvinbryantia formatexigens DSM 14469 TaxID=478749 RepID=C6LAM3_9FIRM|nr:hypothetical protein BRYFOR_05664 [Marvinbryantia formatexigens DSM 14469]
MFPYIIVFLLVLQSVAIRSGTILTVYFANFNPYNSQIFVVYFVKNY